PAAQLAAKATVYALDIDPDMIVATQAKAIAAGLTNVKTILRDFVVEGTGLEIGTADYAMLFNILHAESPHVLLNEAYKVLSPGGVLGIMHWNYDPATPRGPSMEIRPKPEQVVEWARQVGFELILGGIIDLPPYHYGIAFRRPSTSLS